MTSLPNPFPISVAQKISTTYQGTVSSGGTVPANAFAIATYGTASIGIFQVYYGATQTVPATVSGFTFINAISFVNS